MNRTAKMLMMSGGKNRRMDEGRDRDYRERDYERRPERMGMEHHRMDYEPESRFRDRRGREHYDDGRYAPMSEYDGAYSGGYRHMGYPSSPYVPPVYEGMEGRMRPYSRMDSDRGMERERPRNKIGFSIDGEMDRLPDEREHHMGGYSHHHMNGGEPMRFTREDAMAWAGDMVNADGTRGPHWSMEQVKKVMEQRGIDCDPLQFYSVLNAVYSDYCAVAKRHGVGDKIDFYVDMARAWLDDPDADKDKAARYFNYVVKH